MLSHKTVRPAFFPAPFLVSIVLIGTVMAGTIDNRSNFSAAYLRQLARSSDTRLPDAAAYNPAGLAFIDPGLHLEIDNQTLLKFNSNSFDQNGERVFRFKSDLVSPVLPTGFAVWRRQKWAAFASGTLVGGGGNLHYEKGTVTVLPVVAALATANPPTAPDLQLSSLYWAATAGGAYSLYPWLSLSLAGRWVIASTQIKGEARGESLIDHEETANFPTLLFGLHAKPMPGLDIGLRYENIAKLEWTVQKSDFHLERAMNSAAASAYASTLRGTLREKGTTFQHDLPPVASLGIGYTFNPYFRVDVSETFYWQTLADWEGEEDEVDNGWESALGVEVSPLPNRLSLSAGIMLTQAGAGPQTYFTESPALDGLNFAGGGRYKFTHGVALDLGLTYAGTFADHAEVPGLGDVDLRKHTWIYAVSLGWHLPE